MKASFTRVFQRLALILFVGLVGGVLAHAAHAQLPRDGTLAIMVPYPAGGASDIIARTVSASLAEKLGRPVVVENLGGASGAIAARKVLNAPANGLYLYQGTPNELILSPLVNSALKISPDDFQLVQLNTYTPIVLVARATLSANTTDELITLARQSSKTQPLNYGSVGPGSLYHLLAERLGQTIGATMTHVPCKGGAPLLQDMAGDNVDFAFLPYYAAIDGMVAAGRIKIIGQASATRAQTLPNIPTMTEGKLLKNFYFTVWGGYLVKKGTPPAVQTQLFNALQAVMAEPKVRETLVANSMIVGKPMTLEEAAKFYVNEALVYQKLVKDVGIQRQ